MHTFTCKFCRTETQAKRSDAVFCSAVCRTNNNTLENKDRVIAYKKQYYVANKSELDKAGSERYYANKPKLEKRLCQNCQAAYSPTRVDNIYCSRKCGVDFWYGNNPEQVNAWSRTKYAEDLNHKLRVCLRSRLLKALKENVKSDHTVNLLGCSIEELKKHLESKFKPGMSWDNWTTDGWHIDHKKPLVLFDLSDPVQQLEACHYTNLQPLWAEDNLRKGDSYAK